MITQSEREQIIECIRKNKTNIASDQIFEEFLQIKLHPLINDLNIASFVKPLVSKNYTGIDEKFLTEKDFNEAVEDKTNDIYNLKDMD